MSEQKLQELTKTLKQIRAGFGASCEQQYDKNCEANRHPCERVPLVHGTSVRILRDILQSGHIRCRESLQRNSLEHQSLLDTQHMVFTALGVLYPSRDAALVFTADDSTLGSSDATPWDSGHFYNVLKRESIGHSDPEIKDLFDHHRLPWPHYRTYAHDYITTWFSSVPNYLRGVPPETPPESTWMKSVFGTGKSVLGRVFEVRVQDQIRIGSPALRAIFLGTRPDRRLLTLCESLFDGSDVQIHPPRNGEPADSRYLSKRVAKWVTTHIGLTTTSTRGIQ